MRTLAARLGTPSRAPVLNWLVVCLLALSAATFTSVAKASTKDEARIKAAVEKHTQGKVLIDTIRPSPVPGIFEAVSGADVFYVDASGRYSFVDGHLFDLQTSTDLTAQRVEALNRIDFNQLPLHLAIKEVNGNGRKRLAVFEDPACPSCRVLTKFLSQIPDVTIYRFMFPVIDPGSAALAKSAWCAPDRKLAWSKVMQGATVAPPSRPCDTSGIDQIIAAGDALFIEGTPTMFLGDGRRLTGAVPPEQLLKALEASVAVNR